MNDTSKTRKEAIIAGREIHSYLCKQGIYLTECQAEHVARLVDAEMHPLFRTVDRLSQEVDDLENRILHGEEEE